MNNNPLDISTLPPATPNARANAQRMLLERNMIGLVFDPRDQFVFDADAQKAEPHHKTSNRQNFAYVKGSFTHGRDIFKSSESYEAYFRLPHKKRKTLTPEECSVYFKDGLNPSRLNEMAAQVTLDPYSERIMRAEEYCARSAANSIHTRHLRHAQRSGHFMVYVAAPDTGNLGKFSFNKDSIGYHCEVNKVLIAADEALEYSAISNIMAHEAGHMLDSDGMKSRFFEAADGADMHSYKLISRRTLDDLRELLNMERCEMLSIKNHTDVGHAQRRRFSQLKSMIERIKVKRNMSAEEAKGTCNFSQILAETHNEVSFTLPTRERYTLFPDGDVDMDHFSGYGPRHLQIKEIPAVVSRLSNQFGAQFARLLLPELYEAVHQVNKTNSYLSDDPKKFEDLLPSRLARRAEERGGR